MAKQKHSKWNGIISVPHLFLRASAACGLNPKIDSPSMVWLSESCRIRNGGGCWGGSFCLWNKPIR
jgi:hypothetical protein